MSEDRETVCDSIGSLIIYRRRDLPLEEVRRVLESALRGDGETLKVSEKSETRRIGAWVVKLWRAATPLAVLKLSVLGGRYRRAWIAARHLERFGVGVPMPGAFVAMRRLGACTGNALLSAYVAGTCTVEQFADRLVENGAGEGEIEQFLFALADAVNGLCRAGAYHGDLSGKNILTKDGKGFYFVDLDSVVLNRSYTAAQRMKNHIQLYDSFCDRWGPRLLDPFIVRMLDAGRDCKVWLENVHEGQAARRARQRAVWRRQGRLS